MKEFESFFNLSLDPMTIADAEGQIIHANIVYTTLTGWSVDELKSNSYWDLIHPDDHEKVRAALSTLVVGHPVFAIEYRFLCKDGTYKTFLANVTRDKESGYMYALSRIKEGQIIPSVVIANTAAVAVLIVNVNGSIIHANSLAEALFGYESGELAGKLIEELIPGPSRKIHKQHRSEYQINPVNRAMGSQFNLKGLKKNGTEFRADIALNPLHEQHEILIACTILDITESINAAELAINLERENMRLAQLAQRDPLTQAYNRRAMEELFPSISDQCERQNKNISAIMLDVDHFKIYNDTYGHQAGDDLLKHLAHSVQTHTREKDILVRYGGEEFFVIMPNCPLTQAVEAAERIRTSISGIPEGHGITASFGVSTYTYEGGHLYANGILMKLISESDQALYYAKNNGRNRTKHFSDL